jgi:hypothetical protein
MPPRWSRKPDRSDPEYRKLDDLMNFAVHVGIYSTCISGVWFFHNIKNADWIWIVPLSTIWGFLLLLHLLYISIPFIVDFGDR